VVTVQRRFRIEFGIKTSTKVSGYKLLHQAGSNWKRINPGKWPVTEAEVNELAAAFVRSPRKSARQVAKHLIMAQTTVHTIMRSHLKYESYKYELTH
jgi:hypothetical protein